jgi:glycosyltransferase involved in cell wall biosynthesis
VSDVTHERVLVSVITPTKNRLQLLCETMDSVQAQTLAGWEHIVVDDGSDDGTAEEAARRAEADPRVRYIKRTCDGAGANVCRNLGIRESRADLIVFLDSDDLLVPECLEHRCAVMSRNQDIGFATFQAGVFQTRPGDLGRQLDPELIGDDLQRFLFFECPWQTTAPIWRRVALDQLGGFDESLPSWQDVDLHIRAIATGLRYLRFPDLDYHLRWQYEPTKTSVEQHQSPRHLETASRTVEKFERVVREGPGMNWVRARALCSLYFFVAEHWVATGNLSAALSSWRQIRRRSLGTRVLYVSGAALLIMQALGAPGHRLGDRIANKWKGWMRLRTNAELVAR